MNNKPKFLFYGVCLTVNDMNCEWYKFSTNIKFLDDEGKPKKFDTHDQLMEGLRDALKAFTTNETTRFL